MELTDFCDSLSMRPWEWGKTDCSMWVADWVVANGHPDPAASLRGAYSSEQQCLDVIASAGGLVSLFALCAERAGLVEIEKPELGAVAVIGAERRRDRQWGAIWDGSAWLVLWGAEGSLATVMPFRSKALRIWSV